MYQNHGQERVADPFDAPGPTDSALVAAQAGWNASCHSLRDRRRWRRSLIFQQLPSPLLLVKFDGCSTQPHAQYYGTVVLTLTVSKVTVPRTLAL